jgi:hypothetical protein
MVESRFISTNGYIDTSNEHEYGKVFFCEKFKKYGKFPIKYYKFWRFFAFCYFGLPDAIKVRHPSQYSGKNLAKLGKHFVDDATLLESAGQYDHNLMLHMVKIFLQAGGEGKLI